ncbi:MAG: conjugal transfer protein TraF [Desulfomicrobium apsheronum]|nr:conjugal transfer protein TraF [Desulfomicrobium apsheronum]
MASHWKIAAAGIIACALLVTVSARAKVYGEKGQKGWWWYEDPPKQEQEAQDKNLPKEPVYSVDQMASMDTDQLKEYAERVLKEAVRNPTETNVREFYTVQDVIRRKALAFTNASDLVWQKYPELSVAKDDPLAAPGREAVTRQRLAEQERTLAGAREDFALLYFHSDVCPFCHEQETILQYFMDKFRWQVKPIDIERQPQLASRFGILTTPALMLIQREPPDYIPVTAGVASVAEITARVFRGIRLLRGEITPDNFNLYEFQQGGGFDVRAGR